MCPGARPPQAERPAPFGIGSLHRRRAICSALCRPAGQKGADGWESPVRRVTVRLGPATVPEAAGWAATGAPVSGYCWMGLCASSWQFVMVAWGLVS